MILGYCPKSSIDVLPLIGSNRFILTLGFLKFTPQHELLYLKNQNGMQKYQAGR